MGFISVHGGVCAQCVRGTVDCTAMAETARNRSGTSGKATACVTVARCLPASIQSSDMARNNLSFHRRRHIVNARACGT